MYKCAIYTRVSTEEQAENPEGSIKNQELRLREYVKLKGMVGPFGEVVAVFSDPGVSAKDMNRPGFQKMLRAVERREINLILVTELSRFTRSMKDFSLLQEFMNRNSCEFLSLRENFDSSSATGSLVMSIMATLAEFERKQTAERISNSFRERAKRGLYNGGSVPLGYRVDETKPGSLMVVEEEAELVRRVFQTFLKEETLAATAKRLNSEKLELPRKVRAGGSVRGKHWHVDLVYKVLKQKSYTGIRVFQGKKAGEWEETKAVWEPIIGQDEFDRAERLLKKNRNRKRTHGASRYPFILSGSLHCRTCGHRLAGKSATGKTKKIPYYEHSWALKKQSHQMERVKICDSHKRILAERIEPLIWLDVKGFLTDKRVANELLAEAKNARPMDTEAARLTKLEAALRKENGRIETLMERIADLPKGLDPAAFYDQLTRLQAKKKELEKELEVSQAIPSTDEWISLENLQMFTEGLRAMLDKGDQNPEIQAAIIRKIVHRIEVLPDGYEIFYHAGLNHYEQELGSQGGLPGSTFFCAQSLSDGQSKALASPRLGRSQPLSKFSKSQSSNLFANGGGGGNRTRVQSRSASLVYTFSL